MQRNGSSSGEIVKSNIVTLVTYDTYTTTKSASSGSWYYEYTHISGDHFQLPGFIIGNQNRIHVYPQSHTEFIEIAFVQRVLSKSNEKKLSSPVKSMPLTLNFLVVTCSSVIG